MHSCVSGHYRILLLSSQPGYWVGCIECTHRYVTQSVRSEVDDMLHVAGLDRRYKEFGLSPSLPRLLTAQRSMFTFNLNAKLVGRLDVMSRYYSGAAG